jgi:hypothetical protein
MTMQRILSLVLTTLAVCTPSFVFLYRHRNIDPSPALRLDTIAPATAPAIAPAVQQAAPIVNDEAAPAIHDRVAVVPSHAPIADSAPPIVTPPSNYDGPPMQVIFSIVNRNIYATEDDSDGVTRNVTKNVNEVILVNSSDQPLTITATELNPSTQETVQAQFFMAVGMQRHIGPDQGLKMLSGDEITLRSPSYRDLTQSIP